MTAHGSYVRAEGRIPELMRVVERAKERRRVVGRQNVTGVKTVRHRLDNPRIVVPVIDDLRNCAAIPQGLDMFLGRPSDKK